MAEESKKKRIVYCGSDTGYFQNLKFRFESAFEQLEFDFQSVYEPNPDSYQKSFLALKDMDAVIYYIDLTKNANSQALIIQYLKRLNLFHNRCIVALVDDKDKLDMAWESQADFYFIKSDELFDAVNHPMTLVYPEKAMREDFAKARFEKEFIMLEDFKLGFFGPDYIHIETNMNIQDDAIIRLKGNFDNSIIKDPVFKMRKRETRNLYYDFKYAYDLEILLQEPLAPNEEDKEACNALEHAMEREKCLLELEERCKLKAQEHAENQKILKRKYNRWLDDNTHSSFSKSTKILITDYKLDFLKGESKPLDSYPYTIRLHSLISESGSEIDRIMPNIIVFNYHDFKEPVRSEDNEEAILNEEEEILDREVEEVPTENTYQLEQLERIVKKVKTYEDFTPFIIVFNCHSFTTKALQDSFKYPLMMVNKEDVSMDIVLKMAELYQRKQQEKYEAHAKEKVLELRKKDPQKYGKLTVESLEEKRYFVKKTNDLSRVSFEHKIILKSLSESSMSFLSDEELLHSNYRFEVPNEFSFRIVPVEGKMFQKERGKFLYRALIHGTGIKSKMAIRRLVNAVMQLKETELAEKELADFIELNKKVQEEMESEENSEKSES